MWLNPLALAGKTPRKQMMRRRWAFFRPVVEVLEDRTAPAMLTVTNALDPTALTAGTLRYAVNQANADANAGQSDTIVFSGVSNVTLAQGQLELSGYDASTPATITIDGGGQVTIDGNHASRIFQVDAGVRVIVAGLTIEHGYATGSDAMGGGIYNSGTLTVSNSTLSSNSAVGSYQGVGGGIYNSGMLTVSGSTIQANLATGPTFNGVCSGGGISNDGTLVLENSQLIDNTTGPGGVGGGIDNSGPLTVSGCTLSGNSANYEGGGIQNSAVSSDNATVINSTLSGNSAGDFGGGIANNVSLTVVSSTLTDNSTPNYGGGAANFGALSVINSTFSGNSAYQGGGIANPGTLTVTNSTLSGNSGSNSGGGIYNDTNGSTSLNNSIVANSTSGHDLFSASANIGALFGSNDLIGDGSYISTPSSDITDSISANPLLAPLGNYGGPTQTMALLPGSPALGAGSVALAVDGSGNALTTDQRGQPRIVGSAVDIGAFESQGFVLAVTGGADQTALPGAAFASPLGLSVTANNDLEPVNGGVVTFTAPSAGASATLSATSATISSGSASVTATANGTTGSYTVNATAGATTGPAVFDLTNTITEASIQQALSPTTPVTVQANASTDADEVINAVNELPSYSTAVTVTLNLAAGTSYSDLNPGPPAGVTLVINGQGGTTTIVGSSPALTVSSGTVIVTGMTLTTATAAPTVLVTGGSLQLRNDDIESSTGSTEACISLTGGSLDLGTPTDPGGNVFNINGTGTWFANTTSNPILFSGDTFEINGIVQAVGFTVANSNDSGPGSLRQALEDNNLLGGSNTITFDIPMTDPGYDPTTGTFTIAPLSALPVITTPVVIDGTSEASVTGHSGSPLIVFSGVNAGSGAVGLEVTGGGSTIKGLVINQFGGDGIDLTTNGGDVVEGDFIGTDATGSSAAGNGRQGVSIASADNTIGGTTADARNIISGNGAFDSSLFSAAGVYLYGAGATGNVIEGNYIGTDATGTMAVANLAGVFLDGTTGNTIGGAAPGAGNVISGNSLDGVELLGSSGAVVQGNFIGTDKTGTVALGNNYGVLLYGAATDNTIGGTALGAGNLISGNGAGVAIGGTGDSGSSGNVVQGNFIGTDITGTTALGNYYGIGISGDNSNTIGGAAAGARNVISGNIVGVSIQGNSNVVQGNYIGVDISGNKALGNGRDGIDINGDSNIVGVDSSNNPAARNVISGNGDNGVALSGSDNLIAGNLVGLGADGSTVLGNRNWGIGHWGGGSGNTIGGTTAAARNVVSGNGSTGIGVGNADGTSGDVIEGNYIGTDVTGLLARPNGAYGVWFLGSGANTLGGTTLGAGNVISGNGTGVYLSDGTTGVVIAGNLIGLNATGAAALGNQLNGVAIGGPSGAVGNNTGGSTDNTIGGTVAGSANVISGNGADGYDVTITPTAGTGNMVEGNYIGTGVTGTPAPATGPHPFVVTSTADSGPGSLRQTILQADAYYGTASISFALPASGPGYNAATGTWTITPASALPVITEGVILDATTQPGYAGRPVVELDGANAGVGVSGLVITGGNATIKGLDIGGFSQDGIELGINNGNLIEGNYIGTDLSGAVALGNGGNGILIEDGSSGNTIGGIAPGDGNVIGGNGNGPGVQIIGGGSSGSSGNVVEGNLIGTDASGTRDLGNLYGVYITGGGDNTIGGAAAGARNVISGNIVGVSIQGNSNVVQGNYIGVDISGNKALGNGRDGIDINGDSNIVGVDSSNNPAARNVISGNGDNGVALSGSDNLIAGNLVGLGADGSTVLGNRNWGIGHWGGGSGNTIGGTTAAARNVVSGNGSTGIGVGNADGTSGDVIEGNYIGTDVTGLLARPNGAYGVWFLGSGANTLGGTTLGAGNVISGNGTGVYLSDGTTGVVIAGNLIGLNAAGTAAIGNYYAGVLINGPSGAVGNNTGGSTDNTIGGTVAGSANVISGNGADGYDVTITPTAGTGNMVEGNYIGTGVTGTPAPATGPHPFVVTSTADSGPGSLRQTILQADAYYGTASISFALPASGPGYNAATGTWTITPASALPVITEGVILDATTQPGYAGRPVVELDGANAGVGVSGLVITGGNATIKGLDIGGFSQDGIELGINNGNLIEGNYIGTDLSGAVALGNGGNGILIEDGSSGNTIGGIAPGDGNVIGGNGNGPGVQIIGGGSSGSSGNVVEGNLIGTDASGTRDLGNLYGVYITGGGDNTIGGAAAGARNVISGNIVGVSIQGNSNVVQGNYIGVDISGNKALGNGRDGIDINGDSNIVGVDSSNNPAARNVISGNGDNGVALSGSDNLIAGNLVGLGADGSTVLGNRNWGIGHWGGGSGNTIGGTTAAARNVVSGNGSTGIGVGNADGTSGDVIEGNYIGTDVTGLLARPNGAYGVWFLGSGANTLGGTTLGAGNVISGNGTGVYLSDGTTGVVIAGNLIGLNATGAAALGNQLNGVAIGGPSGAVGNNTGGSTDNTVGAGNVISGNGGNGVEIVGSGVTGNVVAGNTIDANALNGVYVTSSAAGNTIGGTAAGAANLIAFNTGAGVAVEGATSIGNPIEGNSIHDNGGLGIDLVSGANDNQATPALTAATTFALGTSVAGMLVSAPDTSFRIEFFSNAAPDPSGNGQGQTYLGSATVTTDENGNATIDATGLAALPAGQTYISATATNLATGDTSEFSHDVLIQVVTSTTLSSSVTPSVYGQPVTLTATVSYPGGGSAPTGTVTFTDGSTTLGVGTVSTSGGITTASYTTTATQLPVGANQTITASYSGDGTFPPSSGTTSQTIVATPLLENGVLAIPGTATAAAYTLTPVLPTGASAYSMKVTRTIGTTTTNLGTFAVSSGNVEVYGGPGTYAVTLRGTANSDAFTAGSGTVINEVAAQATAQATSFTVGLNSVAAFTINGAGGNDSLTGPNQANSWAITGANAGTLDGIATFTGIGNLTGGSGADTFSFADGGSVSGTIDGGGGSNTLDFSSRTTAVTVTLVAGGPNKATATGGWTNIATVIGSAATTDALVGANTTNVWDLTGTNAGSLNGTLAFSGFENLTGGSTNDTFAFFPGGSIAGNLKGGAPINTLDYSDYGSPVAVNLVAKTATGIGGTWATVQNFIGTGTTDTLVGANTNSTWSITGTNAGTVGAYSFAGFPYLTGGSGNNTFAFSAGAAVSGTITGGAGSNTLDYSGYGSPVTVNLQTTTATGIGGTWANIQSFKGTNTTDTLNATDGTTNTWALKGNNAGTVDGVAFTAFANLTGGSGADVFQFANGATVSGIVNGQGGTNTLDYSAYTGGVTVNLGNATTGLPNSSATGVNGGAANGIVNIGNVVVGAGNNYLTAVGAAISVTFTATGNGNNILVGGSGSNTLTASGSGNNIVIGDHGTSTISGGTGYNLLIGGYTAYDAVYADLQSILGIWKTVSSAKTYSKAIANLTASSYAYALTAASVTGNAGDTINAGTHVLDWYFAEAVNEITGENAGETVTLC